jgi:hypothetical protein
MPKIVKTTQKTTTAKGGKAKVHVKIETVITKFDRDVDDLHAAIEMLLDAGYEVVTPDGEILRKEK